ncbi:MAG: thioredoxin [Crenarchaeota archaeon]|nr:MAG: thioredoxin [Thermoproteota archaeon]
MLEITEDDFHQEVVLSAVPVIVDFYSPSCGPCKALVPILEALEKENEISVVKVNVENNIGLATKHGITALPTIFIVKGGDIRVKMQGLQSQQTLQDKLNSL